MNRTIRERSYLFLVLLALVLGLEEQPDDNSESETESVEYQYYELASSPDSNLVYENTYFFEIVTPESLSYTYKLRQAKNFGTNFNRQYNKVKLVVANPVEACRPIVNHVESKIALIVRGGCSFMTKSKHAERAGALAVIIADNDQENDNHMIDMVDDETGREVGIPAMFLMGKDGMVIRHQLTMQGLEEAIINIPLNLTNMAVGTAKQPPWTLW